MAETQDAGLSWQSPRCDLARIEECDRELGRS